MEFVADEQRVLAAFTLARVPNHVKLITERAPSLPLRLVYYKPCEISRSVNYRHQASDPQI